MMDDSPAFLSRLLKEPLLHFVLIGAALFLVYASRNEGSMEQYPADVIEVTPHLANQLAGQFKSAWSREPSPPELEGLIADHIREEVLYRDALALGLDRDDTVIRQRMRLKMELLSEGMAGALVPNEATLAAWFEPRAAEFGRPPRVSFLQVALPSAEDAAAVLAQLEAGAEPGTVGGASLLPPRLDSAYPQSVDSNFGRGFYDAIAMAPEGKWSGPVESAFGLHLVKVIARSDPGTPTLEAVRAEVLEAWRRAQVLELRNSQFEALAARYRIVRSDKATP